MAEALMTLKDCAQFLQVSENTVRSLVKAGMPHYRAGVGLRFDREEVVAWTKAQAEKRRATETDDDRDPKADE